MSDMVAVNQTKLSELLELVWDETTLCPYIESCNTVEQCMLWEKDGSCIECWLKYLTE